MLHVVKSPHWRIENNQQINTYQVGRKSKVTSLGSGNCCMNNDLCFVFSLVKAIFFRLVLMPSFYSLNAISRLSPLPSISS